jgi:hypothetical protein
LLLREQRRRHGRKIITTPPFFSGLSVSMGASRLVGCALVAECRSPHHGWSPTGAVERKRKPPLRAELAVLNDGLQSHIETLKGLDALGDPDEGFNVPDLSQQLRVMPKIVSKFGLLDRMTIQSVIEAYGLVEEHYGKLLILEGGKIRVDLSSGGPRVVWLPPGQAPTVLKINAVLSEAIQRAIHRPDTYLRLR